jgi:hypothetical protein
MFYKVTLIEKNDNHKEMIVKADSKKAAAAMIPAAKAFLFPGEDAEKYDTRIGEFAVDEDGVKVSVKLHGIKIYDRDGDNAENRIQAKLNLYKDEDTFLDSFLYYIEPIPEFEGKPAEAGLKVGEEFTFTFEFESIIEIEQRQFYITLAGS